MRFLLHRFGLSIRSIPLAFISLSFATQSRLRSARRRECRRCFGVMVGSCLRRPSARWRCWAVFQSIRSRSKLLRRAIYCWRRGVRLSHVDSHGHLHKFELFRRALVDVMRERGLRRVRSVHDIYLKRALMSPTYWMGLWWRKRIMASFVATDHFHRCTSAQDQDWPAVPESG